MFNLFKSKSNRFLGIDFGGSAIKAVELSLENQKVNLVNYAWIDFSGEQIKEELDSQSIERITETYLGKLIDKMEPGTKNVFVSIPGFSGLVNVIEIANIKKEEVGNAIEYEAYKYIPISLDEVYLSWDILDLGEKNTLIVDQSEKDKNFSGKTDEGKIKVLLVAAPKTEVDKFESLIVRNGLKIAALELDTFSVTRSLIGSETGAYIVIEIGARTTTIVAIKNGNVVINRNLYIGGNEFTKNIARGMDISWSRAEKYKKEKRDIINTVQVGINFSALDVISGEAKRILKMFQEKEDVNSLDGVIISGGTARMVGILEYFEKELGKNVSIGNPWQQIRYDKKLEGAIDDLGPAFSVAVGAALKGVEEYQRNI
ncbi:MAG: type IV pilus assembly protein PilM [Candidatus Moranbacteria bacterium]|jgi:type IV pilus assembly protein PilM|nr:type IV pilus assembly protein PilM [Candidatus Moranbacteria bacterium]